MQHQNIIIGFPFPEPKIMELKTKSKHFRRLFSEFDTVEAQIHRFAHGTPITGDRSLNDLLSERTFLKDRIDALLSIAIY